jgi:hypothetical protein
MIGVKGSQLYKQEGFLVRILVNLTEEITFLSRWMRRRFTGRRDLVIKQPFLSFCQGAKEVRLHTEKCASWHDVRSCKTLCFASRLVFIQSATSQFRSEGCAMY